MANILDMWRASKGILGLNRRNQQYIRRLNPLKARRLANNKLLTKKLLKQHGIPIPELYKVIRTKEQIPHINWDALPKSFVLKPNEGGYGAGIEIFYGKVKNEHAWIQPDLSVKTSQDISRHLFDILDGKFSISRQADIAFFEERIQNHPALKPYAYKGVPDIRLIVVNHVPIMAELRLPTVESRGKANLHAGGIGVGIDIGSGITTTAIHRQGFDIIGDIYDVIEETIDEPRRTLRGIQIPYWDRILEIAIKCQNITEIGFLGADIAIDREKGPLVLELNTRPGLAIQNANQAGLQERLDKIMNLKVKTVTKGIQVAKTLFGGEIEEEIESITGRQIIGIVEKVTVFPQENALEHKTKLTRQPAVVKAKIDTGARHSSLDVTLALRLGYSDLSSINELFEKVYDTSAEAQKAIIRYKEKLHQWPQIDVFTIVRAANGITIRPIIEVPTLIAGQKEMIRYTVSDRERMLYPVIIGRRDLKNFLIDTSKTFVLH